ncbi:alkaline phosphatase family protein [Sphingobacterium sp. T2]|uniref:alkaline phosphatase family protein n=1 Tax=Sphingobacterium sp. T2 TaxID=1590596 RepID=UPI00057BAAC7|nr:alkaline phosphatase family protein [Sphingobacterium sp. T2]
MLYVIADGIRGKALQQLELPNLKIISRNALHSYGSLGDYEDIQFTKEIGLANLMTGVTSTKHKVVDNSLSQIDQTSYPSLLKRIKSEKNLHTAAFSTNEEFYNVVLKDADMGSLAISDADILTKTKEEISKGTSDLIVSHFSEPYIVGLQHSFEADDQEYLEALRAFDTALGELIETIKQRPTYGQENWLVVITSSIGGPAENSQVDNTSYGDNERNTITFFYNPKFSRSLLTRPNSTEIPYDGSAIRYTYGSPAVNATLQDASSFNFDTSDDFTIVFFFNVKYYEQPQLSYHLIQT